MREILNLKSSHDLADRVGLRPLDTVERTELNRHLASLRIASFCGLAGGPILLLCSPLFHFAFTRWTGTILGLTLTLTMPYVVWLRIWPVLRSLGRDLKSGSVQCFCLGDRRQELLDSGIEWARHGLAAAWRAQRHGYTREWRQSQYYRTPAPLARIEPLILMAAYEHKGLHITGGDELRLEDGQGQLVGQGTADLRRQLVDHFARLPSPSVITVDGARHEFRFLLAADTLRIEVMVPVPDLCSNH